MQKVVLPRLFENMEEGTIGHWLVSPGTQVSIGTPLCELITEKTTLELPSEVEGIVRALIAPEKAVVPPGFVLALVGEADEPLVDVTQENAALSNGAGAGLMPSSNPFSPTRLEEGVSPAPSTSAPSTSAPSTSTSSTPASTSSTGRLRATPAARRAAKDLNVELEAVAAKFPGKVLSDDDVRRFAEGAR